ncbi:MAG: hypothetical protein BGP03_26565 [Pseudonocardia sp. 73-21]|nr:MAG: hypothetical protein BGP03_26565 [Pseudonocardia sp. 73-21]
MHLSDVAQWDGFGLVAQAVSPSQVDQLRMRCHSLMQRQKVVGQHRSPSRQTPHADARIDRGRRDHLMIQVI